MADGDLEICYVDATHKKENEHHSDENDEIVDIDGGSCDLIDSVVSVTSIFPDTKSQYWTIEEQNLFCVGLEKFGNKWTQIAKFIGTRTSSQVKSHAKRYFKTLFSKDAMQTKLIPAVHVVRTTEEDVVDVDELVDSCSTTVRDSKSSTVDFTLGAENCENSVPSAEISNDVTGKESVSTDNLEPQSANSTDNFLTACNEAISEDEKREHPEFFQGGSKKTPSRYIAIRNHILEHWKKKKPHYLSKLAARRGLSHCGDMSSISKIHSYLEKHGAINDNCVQRRRGRPSKVYSQNTQPLFCERMKLRQRRAPIVEEDFTNSGRTLEHDEEGNVIRETFIVAVPTINQRTANPFKLVPCCPYSADDPQPFEVSVDLSAVLIMDTHAHCLKTEVMGLLGGHFYQGRVCVQSAIPCESLSTGIECEMDPVSQAMAGEKIHSKGQQVVGWYHSHPTFAPTPSRRDLETQSAFTDHFWPFVGAIISPFGHASAAASELCFWMMDGNVPRQLKVHHGDIQGILDEELLRNLSHRILFHPDRTALCECYFQHSTYLEKMLTSLRHHITSAGATTQIADKMIFQVRKIFDTS